MLKAGAEKTGLKKALVTGGVAASALLRQLLEERRLKTRGCPEIVFGKPEMSGDNAVGVALIGAQQFTIHNYEFVKYVRHGQCVILSKAEGRVEGSLDNNSKGFLDSTAFRSE